MVGWANPRTGGGNIQPSNNARHSAGQPPDGRGKRNHRLHSISRFGPTPGRAGETGIARTRRRYSPANPRTGGGNIANTGTTSNYQGQPPDGRGKRCACHWTNLSNGPTPGRAGETLCPIISPPLVRANPRTGGGNVIAMNPIRNNEGQPPDGRGKHADQIAALDP